MKTPILQIRLVVEELGIADVPIISCGKDAADFFAGQIGNLSTEVFGIIGLDVKGRPLYFQEVSRGTVSSSLVHPREVFRMAVHKGASSIIAAHNHPSGDVEPSADDRVTTRRLAKAANLMGIQLLDHVIASWNGYFSFQEKGLL